MITKASVLSMKVHFETIGDLTLVDLDVENLDAHTARQFRRDVVGMLPPASRAILDLRRVRFIDSSGCGAILACLRRLDPEGKGPGSLKLCGASKPVRVLFEMVRLHKLVEIYNTREEAVLAYGLHDSESLLRA
jgi:anti-sigma B factor antagonist